jgi:hypothetical protein
MKSPDIKPENGATYYVIRHGRSNFNHFHQKALEEFGRDSEQLRGVDVDPKLVDPELHAIGQL